MESPEAVGDAGAGVGERLAALRARIAAAARRAGRAPESVGLVGAVKRQPLERVAAAVRAGLRDLGENYVQEAQARMAALRPLLDPEQAAALRWHGIGHLQRNKARDAVACFHRIHTLDGARLASELERHAAQAGRTLPVLLQVNLSGEPSKSGVDEKELPGLLASLVELPHLCAVGLMTMPAPTEDPEEARPVFARLRALRDALREGPAGGRLEELSMGMSHDFEVAVEEGATWVRIGTALFGEREER
jgi:pyridoxal phosphate enzyme (YggS family)